MAGLVPAIHVLNLVEPKDVDARHEAGHDDVGDGRKPSVEAQLNTLGFEAIGLTPDSFAKFIDSEMTKYGKIIHDANIKAK